MFLIYVGIIFVISLLWAIFSIRNEFSDPDHAARVKKRLAREKILFKK